MSDDFLLEPVVFGQILVSIRLAVFAHRPHSKSDLRPHESRNIFSSYIIFRTTYFQPSCIRPYAYCFPVSVTIILLILLGFVRILTFPYQSLLIPFAWVFPVPGPSFSIVLVTMLGMVGPL